MLEALYWKKKVYTLDFNNVYYYSKAVKLINSKNKILAMFKNKYKFKRSDLEKCLSIGYYFKTYGLKFKYYTPYDFFNGKFMNQTLEWKNKTILLLEKFGLKCLYSYFRERRFRKL